MHNMAVITRTPLGKSLLLWAVSIVWSSVVLVRMLWAIFKQGPKQYFHVEKRDIRPAEIDDEKYGKHYIARLKVFI